MPAFIKDGPDIPERLLQAHEDGKVVFFCGAGISSAAGLPDFEGLVKRLYENLGIILDLHQKDMMKKSQFDRAINLLESSRAGGRKEVRKEIAKILTPSNTNPEATSTHQALLKLARALDGRTRLVTTNFDRLFEEVIPDIGYKVKCFSAPLLPVPKNRWNGLVYLHGLLPDESNEEDSDNLVVSSSDYGRAYLNERWAARFVSELFRNYTMCFVGYSLNDPVVRYMVDALAVDKLRGETSLEMFSFASYSEKKKVQIEREWKTTGVTPILYKSLNKHVYLHRTLREWAGIYRDGAQGKKMIISQHAVTIPLTTSRLDFAVGQVLWAITDASAAKHFANLDPVPPLKWLKPLSEAQFGHEDLTRFGVAPKDKGDAQLKFSVTRRPSPYTLSPWMCFVDTGDQRSKMDAVMRHLARWLTRHLNDPELIFWLANRGGQLNEEFSQLICKRIEFLDQLKKENKQDELERIKKSAPVAIPDSFMRALWNLILTGKLKSYKREPGLYEWIRRFKQHGLTPVLRMELLRLLTPRIAINKTLSWRIKRSGAHKPEEVIERGITHEPEEMIERNIVLFGDNIHHALQVQNGRESKSFLDAWEKMLPDLLHDFTMLLRDALELKKELGDADEKRDMSFIHQPSISEHPQNKRHHDWTALIDLLRDAWLAMEKIRPEKAKRAVEDWWDIPYPLFKRLVFFVAANSDLITPREALDWLLADDHWWLWSLETKRETIRLLVNLAPRLDKTALEKVERAIVKGPSDRKSSSREDERAGEDINYKIWLRLMKMKEAGANFSEFTQYKLDELHQQSLGWKLEKDNKDEFLFWFEAEEGELVGELQTDEWSQRCRDDVSSAVDRLLEMAKKDEWSDQFFQRWEEALETWSQTTTDTELLNKSWQRIGPVLLEVPDSSIRRLRRAISLWLAEVAKVFDSQEDVFFSLIRLILDTGAQDIETPPKLLLLEDEQFLPLGGWKSPKNLINIAINHPVGLVTRALLSWWYRQKPKDAEGLRKEIEPIFNKLCERKVTEFSHGRLVLAAHILTLFRVDEDWTKENLLPLFDWENSETEAAAVWQGFLWAPRIYSPLLVVIKQYFLETAQHYRQLGEWAGQFVDLLTFLALDSRGIFTKEELRDATGNLPSEGLQKTVLTLTRALAGASERREEYWRNRIRPYMKSVWPQENEVKTPEISEYLALLCMETGEAFPDAIKKLRRWLQPTDESYYVVHLLDEYKLCKKFPKDALKFLHTIVGENMLVLVEELNRCLNDIEDFGENLTDDYRFQRLRRICESSDD